MRRLAVVAAAAPAGREARALDDARAWLGTLPSAGVAWFERVTDVPLEGADLLWLRGAAESDPRLLAWMQAGGRLLATHDGALVSIALGLERDPPGAARLSDPPPDGFGLAGFGAHPLFHGLRDGALLSPAPSPGGATVRWYDRSRPAAAGVVAVERRGLEVHSDRILAWEYAVGAGGMLCLGLEPALPARDAAASGGEAEIVLANALVGDAIPHRERASAPALWPSPGRRAIRAVNDRPGAAEPMLGAPSDAWPPSSMPLHDLTPAAEWTHAGRRMIVAARPATGHREVWAPPFRVMHAAAVRDAIPCAPGHVAADEIAGGLALGGHRLLERWLAAADVPVVAWEIAGPDGIEIVAEWSVDLRRAWPYPDGAYGDLAFHLAADRRSLRVEAAGGPHALYAVTGGALSAEGAAASPVVRVTCAGITPLRIVAAAGADAGELLRSVRVLERGVHELAAARARKATQLQRYGTAFEAPDELLARGFAWARQRGDEALVGVPGIGRSMLTGCPRGAGEAAWCFGARACAAAAAQLVAGNRDPARELLQFLAQTQHPAGGIASHQPLGGLAAAPDAASTVAFLRLAERVLAWTGEADGFRRLRGSLGAALTYLARQPEPDAAPAERVLDALEPLVDGAGAAGALAALRRRGAGEPASPAVEQHAVVEAAAAALRRAPGALPGTEAAPALLEAVAALWGLEPDAQEAALALAPSLPAGWDGCALRGLRIGRSVLDLEVRRRPGALVVRAAHRFGPRLVLTVGVRGVEVEAMDVDDVTLPGGRARFEAHERHEVRFHLAG